MDNTVEDGFEEKLKLIATKSFSSNPEWVYLIDFLNRSLREYNLMFGIKKDKDNNEFIINIYEV